MAATPAHRQKCSDCPQKMLTSTNRWWLQAPTPDRRTLCTPCYNREARELRTNTRKATS
ncbi:hypothetical protein FB466_0634 [Klugiella xanthotipulae]|uniref:Uncharacterized protein n=1 Tax=Klugiella xanthotipulae TaxID=244735 RepID=A0A543I5K4_9MICO|nr:hypothetical protein FB466_0634 [Klugiella xanthotipulae]